jgi:hypothetical protein
MTKLSNLEPTNLKSSNTHEDSDIEDLTNGLQRLNITDYDVTINGEEGMIILIRKNDA